MRKLVTAVTLPVLAIALSACSGSADTTTPTKVATSAAAANVKGTVTVFAAASLKEAFTAMGKQFEAEHPGVKVTFNFASSATLAQNITQGAPADVFASASTANMDTVVKAELASKPTLFARNSMEIVVPKDNPAKITRLADLANKGVKIAVCAPTAPCGAEAQKVFSQAKMKVTPVSQEADVKSVLSKVQLGEVDAGIVYITDVRSGGAKIKGILLPSTITAATDYPIATLAKAPNKAAATAFTDYVLSRAGKELLAINGFSRT